MPTLCSIPRRPLLGTSTRTLVFALLGSVALFCNCGASAQISLSTAVNLALENNLRVRMAQADLTKAQAVLAQTRGAYIPAVSTTAGVGRATGAPLSPPVVFSIAAQSLVFSFSQPDYIRAARAGVYAAQLALEAARSDAAEDAATSYIALDNALQRRAIEREALAIANRLVAIVGDRYAAGVDPHIELTKAQRNTAQLRLQALLVDDEIATNTGHLAMLTGMPAAGWKTVLASIPALRPPPAPDAESTADPRQTQGISAAFASARAREYTAHGEKRYLFRPQLGFSIQYSRLDDAFSSYDFYYPGFRQRADGQLNSFNSFSVGVQLTVPLLDMVHRARAQEIAADAAHLRYDAQLQQDTFLEGRQKLRHSAAELAARADLASLDHTLSQDQLDAVLVRLRAAAGVGGGDQLSPKDAENARLAERQRSLEQLSTELQLRQAEVSLLRQEGTLTEWLAATISAAPAAVVPGSATAPAVSLPDTGPTLPATTGTTPGSLSGSSPASSPAGTAPPSVPTTGTLPSTLPSAPVTTPDAPTTAPPGTPTTPPNTPGSSPHP